MKKNIIFLILISIITLTFTTGCDNDELKGSNITVSVYPIEYLITNLYDIEESNYTITSIYPNGTDVSEYKLTNKQLSDYAKTTTLFVYNGLSNEKEIAKTLINKNKKIQIIDVSYGLKYQYGIEELWLNPNNFLMLANTVKSDLEELSSSKYAADKIEKKYAELEENLTTLDAELRSIAKAAANNGKKTIIIAYDAFGFLEKYGFDIINITNESNITSSIKNKFKDKTYKYIFVAKKDDVSDSIKDLVDNYGAELVEIDTMSTLTDKQKTNKENYLTIMNDFFTTLSNVTSK